MPDWSIKGTNLEVQLVKAEGLKNTEMFTKQDPYCIVTYANQQIKTRTVNDGGVNPVFNSTVRLELRDLELQFKIKILNGNLMKDSLVGTLTVDFTDVLDTGDWEQWHPVYDDTEKQNGKILIRIRYPTILHMYESAVAHELPLLQWKQAQAGKWDYAGTTLQATIIAGRDLRSKANSYVVVEYDQLVKKSQTVIGGGSSPGYGFEFTLTLESGLAEFHVTIWSDSIFAGDSIIGTAKVSFEEALQEGVQDSWVPVLEKSGKEKGSLHALLEYPTAVERKNKPKEEADQQPKKKKRKPKPLIWKCKDGTVFRSMRSVMEEQTGEEDDLAALDSSSSFSLSEQGASKRRAPIEGKMLEVTVIRAEGLRNMEGALSFSKQDPYLVLKYGKFINRTKTLWDAGVNPAFDANMQVELHENEFEISLEIFDDNVGTDPLIGSCKVNIEEALDKGMLSKWYPVVTPKGEEQGRVSVLLKYPDALAKRKQEKAESSTDESLDKPNVAGKRVRITFLEAEGLKNTEAFTKQDPYIVVQYGKAVHRTDVIDDGGTDPIFNQSVDLILEEGSFEVPVFLWNENVGKDAQIGSFRLNLMQAITTMNVDKWIPIRDPTTQQQHGQIHVKMQFFDKEPETEIAPGAGEDVPPQVDSPRAGAEEANKRLEITLVKAQGLKNTEQFTKQDPYVVIQYGTQVHRTKTIEDGGVDPEFNIRVSLWLEPGLSDLTALLWNENVGRDTAIGTCTINLKDVLTGGPVEAWYPVLNKSKKQQGKLQVKLQCVEAEQEKVADDVSEDEEVDSRGGKTVDKVSPEVREVAQGAVFDKSFLQCGKGCPCQVQCVTN